MDIALCQNGESSWNHFVEQCSNATVFHLYEWREAIQKTYGHRAFYLSANVDDQIEGVLPLFLINSKLFGRALVSLPFTDYGGICHNGDPDVCRRLVEEALRLGKSLSVDYLQLRHGPFSQMEGYCPPSFEASTEKVTMLLELDPDTERIWKGLPPERRNRIKKAKQRGLTTRLAGVEALEDFYQVFSENMRDLGSPVHSKLFFKAVLELLGKNTKLLLVECEKKVIGAAFCLFFKRTILIPWVSSLRPYFQYSPNMLLYWTAIQHGCEQGYRVLDFGRSSRDSGTYEFKRQWGAQPVILPWQGFVVHGKAIPSFSKNGFKERLLISCWKQLPLAVTRYVGPLLRGSIPA